MIDSIKKEQGFSLVELGIVMLIIGVLAAGVLKGREVIDSSRVAASVSQIKEIDQAFSQFWDKYQSVPGDMINPTVRLANCVGVCAQAGDGNNRLSDRPQILDDLTREDTVFWAHLSASGFFTETSPNPSTLEIGVSNPEFPINGSVRVGYHPGSFLVASTDPAPSVALPGHYLCTAMSPAVGSGQPSGLALTPSQAYRVDKKLDDGMPNSGSARALGSSVPFPPVVPIACVNGNGFNDTYNTGDSISCNLYIKTKI